MWWKCILCWAIHTSTCRWHTKKNYFYAAVVYFCSFASFWLSSCITLSSRSTTKSTLSLLQQQKNKLITQRVDRVTCAVMFFGHTSVIWFESGIFEACLYVPIRWSAHFNYCRMFRIDVTIFRVRVHKGKNISGIPRKQKQNFPFSRTDWLFRGNM